MEKRDGRSERKIVRVKEELGQKLCYCSAHKDFLPCEHFHKSKTYEHGFDYRCVDCIRNMRHANQDFKNKLVAKERVLLNAFYRNCGYDPESPIPIHEQFLIRHDL